MVLAVMAVTACPDRTTESGIDRDAAIAIAVGQVSFEPDRVEAEEGEAEGRPTWRVRLEGRLPGQPPGLFESLVVDIDQETGAVLSLARP